MYNNSHHDILLEFPQQTLCLITHWGRLTHILANKLTMIGSDNGLLPSQRQTITENV